MSIAFWSAKVSGKNSVVVQPPEGFVLNVTQLALTDAKAGKGSQVVKVKTVSVEGDELESVIATLRSPGVEQCSVSLVFGYDVPTEFSTSGDANGTVYLSGYYQPGTDEDEDDPYGGAYGEDEEDGDSDDSDEEDSQDEGGDEEESSVEDGSDEDDMDEEEKIRGAEAAIAKLGAARKDALIVDGKAASSKLTAKGKTATAAKKTESSDDDDDDDDDDESSDDDSEEKMIRRNQLSASSDGGDDSSSSDEEEEPPLKLAKGTAPKGIVTASGQKQKQRQQQQQQQQHSTPNGAKTAPPNTPATAAKSKTPGTGAGAAAGNSKKTPQGMQAQHSNKGKGHPSGNKRKH